MSVTVHIPGFLRQLTNSKKIVQVNGTTVGECLKNLVQQFPATEELVLGKDGQLLSYIDVYVNGTSAYPDELNKAVNSGDELSILLLISGG